MGVALRFPVVTDGSRTTTIGRGVKRPRLPLVVLGRVSPARRVITVHCNIARGDVAGVVVAVVGGGRVHGGLGLRGGGAAGLLAYSS